MRILHLVRSCNPKDGGPIEVVKHLGLEFIEIGVSVEVASLDSPDSPWVKSFPLPVHPLGPAYTNYGYSRLLLPWLRQHAPRFDIVVANGIWQYHSLAAWRLHRATGIPYVVFPHCMLDPWFKRYYPMKHVKKWLYWPWAEYRVLRDASAVIFTSEEERVQARQSFWLYRCREQVINYGTAPPPPEEPGARTRLFERFPSLAGKRLILFLGRIHEKKGPDLLIRSFARAVRTGGAGTSAWHLVLAGPPVTERYKGRLEQLIGRLALTDRVTWTGMLTGADKWAALRGADALALPSHQENFGVVVAEALGCGVPVLISNKVNIWREVLGDGAGLVEPDDQAGTDRLLASWAVISEPDRARMRVSARQCFVRRFDVRNTAKQLAAFLEPLAVDPH